MAYSATIRHHSISRARHVTGDTLPAVKRAATREFAGEQLEYRIVILDEEGIVVSERRVGADRWTDRT